MSEELKPCPFCGGEAIMSTLSNELQDVFSIACIGDPISDCVGLAGTGFYEDGKDLIRMWNRRKSK